MLTWQSLPTPKSADRAVLRGGNGWTLILLSGSVPDEGPNPEKTVPLATTPCQSLAGRGPEESMTPV